MNAGKEFNSKKVSIAEKEDDIPSLIDVYKKNRRLYELFLRSVESDFLSEPSLNSGTPAVIHSTRSRLKDEDHLAQKILRKRAEGRDINPENLLSCITDLAGLRVLHLHQNQFSEIHEFIKSKTKQKDGSY